MPRLIALFCVGVGFASSLMFAACSNDRGLTETTLLRDTVSVNGNFRETASMSSSVLRPAIDVVLSITSQSDRPETLFTTPRGSCDGGVIVRAWRVVNGQSRLAWSSAALPFIPCPAIARPTIIAPHGTVSLLREVGNAEILGDSLPADNYILTASADLQSPLLPAEVTAGQLMIRPEFIVPPGTVLDGTWSGQADGIQLRLVLHWTADSVTGSGTYLVVSPNTNRCGGTTLHASGSVKFAGGRAQDRVLGGMAFDNGWTPPYIATLASAAFLDGRFMSIDVGPCPMPLSREVQAVP